MRRIATHKYNKVIRLMLPGQGGKRNTHGRITAIGAVKNFQRMQDMIKRQGVWMFTELEHIGHIFSQGQSKKLSRVEFKKKCDDPNEHTQIVRNEIVLAVRKPMTIDFEDKLTRVTGAPNQVEIDNAADLDGEMPSMFRNFGGRILVKARGPRSAMRRVKS